MHTHVLRHPRHFSLLILLLLILALKCLIAVYVPTYINVSLTLSRIRESMRLWWEGEGSCLYCTIHNLHLLLHQLYMHTMSNFGGQMFLKIMSKKRFVLREYFYDNYNGRRHKFHNTTCLLDHSGKLRLFWYFAEKGDWLGVTTF